MELNEFRPPLLSVSSSMFSPFWTDFSGKEETGVSGEGGEQVARQVKQRQAREPNIFRQLSRKVSFLYVNIFR